MKSQKEVRVNKFPFTINNHILIASEMMQVRLKLNVENHQLLKELCYEEWEKCKSNVSNLAGQSINVSSDKEVHHFLYEGLKLKKKYKRTKNGPRVTADENALRELRVQYPQHKEVLNAFIKERHIKKKIESYIEFEVDEDGYIPHSANPAGTETNRWSFSKSPRNRGFNTQTMPKVMRIMCDAPPERVFICPDLPQADARIVAWDAECERQIALFNDPTKHFHLENCIGIQGLTREQVYAPGWKNTSELYKVGKRRGHAGNYREQAKKLAIDLGCSVKEAQWFLDDYFKRAPEILNWHKKLLDRVRKRGGLHTPEPFNRNMICHKAWGELMLYGKIGVKTWNELCAKIPQSAVADIINVGMEKLWLAEPEVRFHKHDHDSYLASVPSSNLGRVCSRAMDFLKVELKIHGRPLIMVPEMSFGFNYGLMQEWKGEEIASYDEWWEKAKGKMDREKIRKDLYGYY